MTLPQDPKPLKGVARSLDDLFTKAAPAEAPVQATPAPPAPKLAPVQPPPVQVAPVQVAPTPIPVEAAPSASDFPLVPAMVEAPALPVEAPPPPAPVVAIVPPPPPPPVVEAAPPPLPTRVPTVEHEIAEGPLLDADVLVEEIAGPAAELEKADPEEERRARVRVAMDSLEHAVESLVAGEGDEGALAALIRDEGTHLRDENFLEPLIDAVERLARVSPDDSSDLASDLARQISSPAVAAGLALRVAGTRDDARREELFQACRALGESAAVALATALADEDDRTARSNLVKALVALGDQGLKQAEVMVQETSPWGVVRNGVAILGELGSERAVEHLMDTLQHHKPQVRIETLNALAHVGGESAVLLVTGKLDDPDDKVRATAVRAAATLGSDRTVKVLLGRLDEEENKDVQIEILRALGQFGDPLAVPAIEKRAVASFFSRPPVELRIAAYRALAAIRTPHARSVVEAALEDKDPEVKSVARTLMAAEREAKKQVAALAAEKAAEKAGAATPAGAPAQES